MAIKFKRKIIEATLKHEGGYTNNPKDPGNWTGGKVGKGRLLGTNMGIAAHAFPHLHIPSITKDTAVGIYEKKYWDKLRGDDLPIGVDAVVYDYGVNSGTGRAAKCIQRISGAKPDGAIGTLTLKAINKSYGADMIKAVARQRMSFLRGLSIFKTFGKGWTRRVAENEAFAMSMFLSQGRQTSASEAHKVETLKAEAKTAKTKSKRAGKTSATGGTGSIAVVATDYISNGNSWLLCVAAVLLVCAGLAFLRGQQEKARAEAYDKAASVAI